MKNALGPAILSLILFPSLSAYAQTGPLDPRADEAAPAPADAPLPPPDAMPEAPVLAPTPSAPDVAAQPTPAELAVSAPVAERVEGLAAKVDGIDESLAATKASVDKLSKLKVSGYIQARFEWHADSADGLNTAGKPASTNRFFVRRGRLKTLYDGTNAEYMLQIDATGDGVVLKDAEATFVDTWSPLGLRLTVGQFKWPFGYEILQSSGDREMPERSLVIRKQFPGERDRGFRVQGKYDQLRFAAALVNGNGTQDSIYGTSEQSGFKDLVARVGGDFEWLVFGVSGYWGRTFDTTVPAAATLAWTDKNMDKMVTADELAGTAAKIASIRRFSVLRMGLDAQLYFDIPSLGGLAVKGEFVLAKRGNLDPGATDATTMTLIPQSCYDTTAIGWIVTAVQNFGDNVGAVLRVDSYDPNYSKSVDPGCPVSFVTAGKGDRTVTTGGGLLLHGSSNIKATLTYEHLSEQGKTVANDIFTAQLQARF